MMKISGILILTVFAAGCGETQNGPVQRQTIGYVFTDGFPGPEHLFVRGRPFNGYSEENAEDACITFVRATAKNNLSSTPCQPQEYIGRNQGKEETTRVVCTTVCRGKHNTEYCWTTADAFGDWKPGTVLVDREPTTMAYGMVYEEKK